MARRIKLNIIALEHDEHLIRNCMPGPNVDDTIHVSINGRDTQYDQIVVLQSTREYKYPVMQCKAGNSLLIVHEPQDILRIPPQYVNQFDHVVTPNSKIKGRHTVNACFGQLWSMNKTYDELRSIEPPFEKLNKLSAVISTKAMTKGHRHRLNFVYGLKEELGDLFDWYGKGVHEIEDKWDAIYPYQYHLAFENGKWPHYWTEKLTDAYMGYSMPIYIGCPNVDEYFSPDSYIQLNDRDPGIAADQIRTVIKNNDYSNAVDHITDARNRIFNQYGLFPMLELFIANNFNLQTDVWTEIDFSKFRNTVHFYYPRKAYRKVRHSIRKYLT